MSRLATRLTPGMPDDRKTVRAGDAITARIHLEHTRPRTATVPFSLWIEDSDGTFIVGTTTPPMTFRYGDTIDREIVLQIPDRVQPGVYTLLVGIGEMQQGVAAARQSFRVIR